MPCVAAFAGAWVLEGFVLESPLGEPNVGSVGEELLLVRRDEMRHRAPLPEMTVQPQATVHRVQHSLAPVRELAPGRIRAIVEAYWHPGTPSCGASGGGGVMAPA